MFAFYQEFQWYPAREKVLLFGGSTECEIALGWCFYSKFSPFHLQAPKLQLIRNKTPWGTLLQKILYVCIISPGYLSLSID